MKIYSLLPLLLPFFLFSQDPSGVAKQQIQVAATPKLDKKSGELLIEGITLVPGGVLVEDVPRDHGITIEWEGIDDGLLASRLREFLNNPLTPSLIDQIKSTIVNYFREEKREFVAAVLPLQQIVNENIIFEILEGKVGSIQYVGQKWFSERVIRNRLGIKKGDPINEVEFLNDVTWLNRNPFIHSKIVMIPGEEKGVTDLCFETIDRFPARFYVGSDNMGYLTNGTLRVYGGFNWGNALTLGDILSYQYTASINFHSFQSHILNYTSFLPWKNFLTVFGCYGQIYPNIPDFQVNGIVLQGSARYEIPIPPLYGSFRSSSTAGFDYKFFTSNLFFVGNAAEAIPASNQIMAITQFLANYQFQQNWKNDFLSFKFDFFFSPWTGLVPHQTPADYDALRAGSSVRYAYGRLALNYIHSTQSDWRTSILLRGQGSSAALPTSEQWGLGGYDTVRGYFEQQFVADNAGCLNLELYPPTFRFLKKPKTDLALLAFIDYGYGYNYVSVASQFRQQNLIGVGPGLRLDTSSYLSVKMDYGFQILGIPGDHRIGRFHFSANASY